MTRSNEKLSFDDIVEIFKNSEEVTNTVSDKFSIGVAKLAENSQNSNPTQSASPPNNANALGRLKASRKKTRNTFNRR